MKKIMIHDRECITWLSSAGKSIVREKCINLFPFIY